MAAVQRICSSELLKSLNILKSVHSLTFTRLESCKYATVARPTVLPDIPKGRLRKRRVAESIDFSRYATVYPEFLPDPDPKYRHPLREKLERKDMLARRKVIDIPEFYVGSIVAVTVSDIHAPGKSNRFLGICIQKTKAGLRATFTLRNVVDKQGIEIRYDLYDPTIQKIECIRLEKRLDDDLCFLRDCPKEYSTFPMDMKAEFLPENSKVPVNDLIVPLNPPPYTMKWHLKNLKGISNIQAGYKTQKRIEAYTKLRAWEKYDLMKIYRETIPDEDRLKIFHEVANELDDLEKDRRKILRSALVNRSKKK